MNASLLRAVVLSTFVLLLACGDDDDPVVPAKITAFSQSQNWTCAQSTNCQDVFNIDFAANSIVSLGATDVTGGSIVQLALYAPGVQLGGINLLTGNTNEFRCGTVVDCDSLPDGQAVQEFLLVGGGVYRLAVTRDGSDSCGNAGTYLLSIGSDKGFPTPSRSYNDITSLAPGNECP